MEAATTVWRSVRLVRIASLILLLAWAIPAQARDVRVGVFQNPPIVIYDKHGQPAGLAIDVLETIARQEGWKLHYVSGTWQEVLEKLERGQIDLLTGIAWSETRAQRFRFTSHTLVNNWAVVYRNPDVDITSILELRGRRVALMKNAIHSRVFRETMGKFGLPFQAVEMGTYDEVLQTIARGQADAGVVNRLFSIGNAARYEVRPTTIVFNPVSVRYAAPGQADDSLIVALDRWLERYQQQPDSPYYAAIHRWLDQASPSGPVSRWWFAAMGLVLLLGMAILLWNHMLRQRVAAQMRSLNETEERWKSLVESMPNRVAILNLEGEILYANRVSEGRTVEGVLGTKVFDYLPEIRRDESEQILREVGRTGKTVTLDVPIVGEFESRYFTHTVSPLHGEGSIDRVLVVSTDITERMSAEREVRRAREFLQAIYDASPDMIFVHDVDGRLLEVNENVLRTYGYTREEMLNLPPETFMGRDHRPEEAFELLRRAQIGEEVDVEWTARRRDGFEFPVEVRLRRLSSGAVLALVRDISLAKHNEALQRRQSESLMILDRHVQRLLGNVESIGDFYRIVCEGLIELLGADLAAIPILSDTENEFVYMTAQGDGAELLSGRRFKLDDGGLCGWVVSHRSSVRVDEMELDSRVRHDLSEKLGLNAALIVPLYQQDRVIGGLSAYRKQTPFDDLDEQIIGLYAQRVSFALENLNLRLHLENLVAERTAQLQATNQELEAFAYSVSHDLRAPLRAIDGFSAALLEDYEDQLDATAQDYLQRVCRAAERMGELIDDLLQLSRVTRSSLTWTEVDLRRLAEEVTAKLREQEPEREVTLVLGEGLRARGDARLLTIVLENLFSNAWKFTRRTDDARIEFGVTEHDGGQAFYIKDNGAGFDMAYADKLFGAFQRLHSTEEFEGTGIGLATVQRIIHRHGGKVWAESGSGKGATFYFTLGTTVRDTRNSSGDRR